MQKLINRYEFKISGLNFIFDAKVSGTLNECIAQVMKITYPIERKSQKSDEISEIINDVEENLGVLLNIKTTDRKLISYRKMLLYFLYCEKGFSAGKIEKCFISPKRSCIIKQALEVKGRLKVDSNYRDFYKKFKERVKL